MEKAGKPQFLSYEASLEFLHSCEENHNLIFQLFPKKHRISALDGNHQPVFYFLPPLPFPNMEAEEKLEDYNFRVSPVMPSYVLVLIQAGASALGYFVDGEPLHHKAIKKYMKRHKRGKSQISYLKTRGKSKAGSRIRLANTVRFFEEINERLTTYEEEYEPERMIYSCTAQLWGLLFQSKVPPPFEKKDPRLIKVPKDVNIPTYEELLNVNEFIQKGLLTVYQEGFI